MASPREVEKRAQEFSLPRVVSRPWTGSATFERGKDIVGGPTRNLSIMRVRNTSIYLVVYISTLSLFSLKCLMGVSELLARLQSNGGRIERMIKGYH